MIALSVNARDFVPGKGLHPSRPRPKLDQTSSGKERENDPSKWLDEELWVLSGRPGGGCLPAGVHCVQRLTNQV